ncbi:hypothetical protein C8Q75DRAFT_155085 [Abortiporus biennis]|nr:hypothetical protein C8Q75DRAFT_155085 [Abortiporus biennis]
MVEAHGVFFLFHFHMFFLYFSFTSFLLGLPWVKVAECTQKVGVEGAEHCTHNLGQLWSFEGSSSYFCHASTSPSSNCP